MYNGIFDIKRAKENSFREEVKTAMVVGGFDLRNMGANTTKCREKILIEELVEFVLDEKLKKTQTKYLKAFGRYSVSSPTPINMTKGDYRKIKILVYKACYATVPWQLSKELESDSIEISLSFNKITNDIHKFIKTKGLATLLYDQENRPYFKGYRELANLG